MFDHVTIRVSDRAASEYFYTKVLGVLGIEQTYRDEHFVEWDDFSLAQATDDHPATRRLHIAFVAPDHSRIEKFWRAGTDAGYEDDGGPGPRPQYREDYYGAFLLDPDGNNVEAVYHGGMRPRGVDHLWIRVADVDEAARFYELVASHAGFRRGRGAPDRAQFVGAEQGSFSLVAGLATERVHLAFAAHENAVVDAFHAALVGAGYRDNGAPGERPIYHPGYYGAFVLDPDGNNVEVVSHNRKAS